MSIMDDDPDAAFLAIMGDIELAEPTDAVDYRFLSDQDLAKAHSEVRTELFHMDQLHNLNPVGHAADLHSRFAAINHEMRRRWKGVRDPNVQDTDDKD